MGNLDAASRLIAALRGRGAREFCVCAGSRNAPLLAVLGTDVYAFVDERSAAFFAIGRIKAHGFPVAVVTTSGTAAAELLPAAIEAYYSGLPLILVTADRPARFRGTGAPQSIEQIGLFGVYAETDLESWSRTRPLHVNIEFDEPLIDGERPLLPPLSQAAELPTRASAEPERIQAAALPALSRPLVLIGGLAPRHRRRVKQFALKLNAPVYAEPLSGLREDRDLPLITAGERMIGRGKFESVIRIGNVPTLRFWRDLETLDLPVTHFSELPLAGLTRGEVHPIEALPELEGRRDEAFLAAGAEQRKAIDRILDAEPRSELTMLRTLSRELAEGTRVYLGNSLPIREWDLVATRERRFEYEANRGANGIDGQLSTYLGWCDGARDSVGIVGDLTAIYDLGAPWIVPQLGHRRFRIVIVNNCGGRIFGRVASLREIDTATRERVIENIHGIRFGHWAEMWNISEHVTELNPDEKATTRAWERYDELWT
jgi:2-succinyl-5-enolpyruvyl-6-hydroxy-3-cyclohexene-1-carboxylate synthase